MLPFTHNLGVLGALAVQEYLQLNRPLRSRRKARKERHCDRRVAALTIGLHHSVVVICLYGIAFFLIRTDDQEKTEIHPWRPWRLSGSRIVE
jgi:hypothetical protein